MLTIIAFLCLITAFILLIILSIIDLKVLLLPNEFVLGFATSAIVFHLVTFSFYLPLTDIILGAVIGFGLLYGLRSVANWYYKQDTLGLGDVKLMGAAGLWLGVEGILFSLTLGAFAGLIHGVFYATYIAWKDKTQVNLQRLAIPAGPGFAIGIVLVGGWLYNDLLIEVVKIIGF